MSRYGSNHSYGHWIKSMSFGGFRIGWTVDFYYPSSRLRFPRGFTRDTELAGAKRFCKKWGLDMPETKDVP